MTFKGLWIDGFSQLTEKVKPIYSLDSGKVLAEVSMATQADVVKAIKGAFHAFHTWREQPAHLRSRILFRVAEALENQKEDFAGLIAEEAGKPIKIARGEVLRTVQTYRFSAEEAKRIGGETIPLDAAIGGENRIGMTWREPLGVVAAITPFNFPLNLVAHKLGPALAAGNTVVLKPAGSTPLAGLRIAELFHEAGLPAGALQVVTGAGSEIGNVLITHPLVKAVTFTGSPAVGKALHQKSGLKRMALELGSNSAVLIEPDASLEVAARRVVEGAFQYAGQVCIAVQRVFIHEAVFDRFLKMLKELTAELKVANPLDEGADVGPMIDVKEAERVHAWVTKAVEDGARVEAGGSRDGAFFMPTILVDVKHDMDVMCREVFGPVASIIPYRDLEQAIKMANDSKYGLNVGIFTRDIQKAFYAAKRLEAGGIMINDIPTFRVDHMPYGGVKESGLGREGIKYAIESMTELKFLMFKTDV